MPVVFTKTKEEKNLGAMDKLPQTKTKNGYNYTLIKRNTKAAIYEQVHPDFPKNKAYEVLMVTVTKPSSILQKKGTKAGLWYQYPLTEKFPGNEDFGKNAWAFNSLESATTKYEELTNA